MPINWKNASVTECKLFESISILFAGNEVLLKYVFDPNAPKLKRRPGILREDAWGFSHGEELLIHAALDLWSGSGHLAFWDCLETWDDQSWTCFIKAICDLKKIDLCSSKKASQ
jgi:hypothetical protein